MTDNNIIPLNKPEAKDPLQEILREGEGAKKLLARAVLWPNESVRLNRTFLFVLNFLQY